MSDLTYIFLIFGFMKYCDEGYENIDSPPNRVDANEDDEEALKFVLKPLP